jgi:hypothetical protein
MPHIPLEEFDVRGDPRRATPRVSHRLEVVDDTNVVATLQEKVSEVGAD